MGRTLVVQAFLLATALCSLFVPTAALGAGSPQDRWEEMESWLDKLCALVHCPPDFLERIDPAHGLSSTDIAAVRFVISYYGNGLPPELTAEELATAQAAVEYAAIVLQENPGILDPEVEKELDFTFLTMQWELGM